MKKLVVRENTRVSYTDEMSIGSLPLDKAEQMAVQTMMAYFDPRYPGEEIPVDIRGIARISGKKLGNLRVQFARAGITLTETAFYRLDLAGTGNKKRPANALVSYEGIPLFKKIRFDAESDMLIGIFNELIIPLMIANDKTPIYRLSMLYDFRSQYSFRLLALIVKKYLESGKKNSFFIPLDELQAIVISPKKERGNKTLFRVSNFNQSVMAPALRDINNYPKSPITITVEEVLGETGKRGGDKTMGYTFSIEEKEGMSIEMYMDKIDLTDELVKRGFTRSLAKKVTEEKSWNVIRRNMYYFDSKVKKNGKSSDQLGKILYTFIEQDTEKKERRAMEFVNVQHLPGPPELSLFEEDTTDEPFDLESSQFYQEYKEKHPGRGVVVESMIGKTKNLA